MEFQDITPFRERRL